MNPIENRSSPRAQRWLQAANLGWLALTVALCVKVLAQGIDHSVYGAFVIGPRHWWAGTAMYTGEGYFYSPTFSVLFTPFALLPDWLGQSLWGIFSVGLFLWSLRVFYRQVMPRSWPREAEAIFLALVLVGALRGIWSLQSNAVLMAGILLAAAALVRFRWWPAAWLLAAPVYIKLWPLIAGALLSLQWPRKLIGRLALALVALGLIPFLTKSPGAVVDYYQAWVNRLTLRQENVERFTGYRDAWTIWEQIHTPVDSHAYFWLQAGAGLAVLAWCLWLKQSRNHSRQPAELVTYTLAAWCCWQLLLGPGTERLTYLIIAPLAAWALIDSYLERRNFAWAVAAFVTLFVLGAGFAERIMLHWLPAAVALQPLGVVLFAAWLVRRAMSTTPWDEILPLPETAPRAEKPNLGRAAA